MSQGFMDGTGVTPGSKPLLPPRHLPFEGCERRGGVCDCGGLPCALDNPNAVLDYQSYVKMLEEIRPDAES